MLYKPLNWENETPTPPRREVSQVAAPNFKGSFLFEHYCVFTLHALD